MSDKRTTGRRWRRIILFGLGAIALFVATTTVVALLPPVQRAVVHRIASATPGVELAEVGADVAVGDRPAGKRGAEQDGLRLPGL